ncbi:hypothetical protein AMJ51_00610 [Microgenomates bacterium DG_75]|nr:MAG: hypothetical protein AMJ51_00610 [Microgenomates bacterium DG_75]
MIKSPVQLIAGGLFEERIEVALELIRPFFSQPIDLDKPPEDLLIIKPENSIGINQVRVLKKFLSLRPYQAKNKVSLFLEAEKLTLPAQNSLLKTLEEPPPHSSIILLVNQLESLLPTIISRVKITRLPAKSQIRLSQEERQQLGQTLESLLTVGVGKRIELSLTLVKDKHQALILIERLLFLWRQFLLIKTGVKKPAKGASGRKSLRFIKKLSLNQIEKAIKNTEQIRKMLVANVNFHLAIENLFLSYPQL